MRDANDGRNIPRVELFCQRIILYSYKYMLDFFTIKNFADLNQGCDPSWSAKKNQPKIGWFS